MTSILTKHPLLTKHPSNSKQLIFSDIPISTIEQQIGQTPFYAYSRRCINQRMADLRQHMPNDLKIHYAIKANPMPALVQHMATLVDGFDTASAGEMRIALDTTIRANNISIAGPGKRVEEIQQAIAAGITINVESLNELTTIEKCSEFLGVAANIAIRINPLFELKTAGIQMGGGPKPFGIDEEKVPEVLQKIKQMNLNFEGFHVFSGSQNLVANSIIEAHKKTFELIDKLSIFCPSVIKSLNIGGGFGIPYFAKDMPLDTRAIGDALSQSLLDYKQNNEKTEVLIELGRYLVGEAGIYVCQIIDKKKSRDKTYLIVNGGLHHHLAATGNFGQIIRKNFPIIIGNRIHSTQKEHVNISGPLCTPLDTLAENIELPKAEIGDLVVILQSGAYGYTASPQQFLSQPTCIEAMI